jgi:hypothetical protein
MCVTVELSTTGVVSGHLQLFMAELVTFALFNSFATIKAHFQL